MGYLGTIVVYDIRYGEDLAFQTEEHSLRIQCERSKPTVAAWSYLDKYIIAGHEDGSVSQFDTKVWSLISSDSKCPKLIQCSDRRFASGRRCTR